MRRSTVINPDAFSNLNEHALVNSSPIRNSQNPQNNKIISEVSSNITSKSDVDSIYSSNIKKKSMKKSIIDSKEFNKGEYTWHDEITL